MKIIRSGNLFLLKRVLRILVLVVLALEANAAEPGLKEGFLKPPSNVKPKVYWFWIYNRVDREGITRDLEEFAAKGITGVNLICNGGYAGIEPLFGVEFLSAEWRDLLRHAIREANRLKIEIGFNLSPGWVMLGPWVTPDNAMKKVVQTEVKMKGPVHFSDTLPTPPTVNNYYHDVWVQAFRSPDSSRTIEPKDLIDLTERLKTGGRLDWDVPEGEWTIIRTGYTQTGSRWDAYPKGDVFTGGDGYQIDYLNRSSLDDHFNYLGKLVLDEAKNAGGHFDYFWSDSWECGPLTWTQDFPAQFRLFRGYDLKPYMPALSGYTVIDRDVTQRFLADFNRTIQDCIAENFYGHFAELCHVNGLQMGNEAAGPGVIPPMDCLRNLGRCDVPAGEFWVNDQYKFAGGYNLNLKQTASAAHTYGRKQAMAEAFTQQEEHKTHWYYGPDDLKPFGDIAYCEGINEFMLHAAVCQPAKDGKPGYQYCAGQHWDPNITWWDQSSPFFLYLSRCQYMLQQGLFVGDACFYLGEEPPIIAPPKYEIPGLGWGYDCDYCNPEVLLKRMSVRNGRVVLPDGMSYRLLVLQNCTSTSPEICKHVGEILALQVPSVPSVSMSVEVLKKIRELVHDGATVVGPRPEKSSGLRGYPQCDHEVKKIASEVWGDCDGLRIKEHQFGRGRVIWGRTPREILIADGIRPDFSFDSRADSILELDFLHRAVGDTDIYFVSNRTSRVLEKECTFRVRGVQPEIWDPVSGDMRDATAFTQAGSCTTVPLEFVPHGSLFIVFRKHIGENVIGNMTSNFPKFTAVQNITGAWTVRFDTQWGGPSSVEFSDLISWTQRPEEGIKYYSGKATYVKVFDFDDSLSRRNPTVRKNSRQLFLDLGTARHVAEVRLNGKNLGILWTAPWRVDITDAVRPTGNVLEIDVINLWANRVIGDLNLPKGKRITTTHDGFRFDMITKTTPLLESGLLGPVTILTHQ